MIESMTPMASRRLLVEDAMRMSRCFLWSVCACLFSACAGDELSVGDLRCIGDGVECERPTELLQNSIDVPLETVPSGDAQLKWRADLPCPTDGCAAEWTSLLAHADGSTTVAIVRQIRLPKGMHEQDLWIGRFDPDGVMLGEDRLADTGPEIVDSMALARGPDDEAVLAVLTSYAAPYTLTVYSVAHDGKTHRLFETEGADRLSAIAMDRKDVLVADYYWPYKVDVAPSPELARYRRDGTLVWRQSALRAHSDADLGSDGQLLETSMPLVVDEHGRAILAIAEYRGSSLAAVGRDGNLDWSTSTADLEDRGDHALLPLLDLDSENHPLLAGPINVGTGYGLERFNVNLGSEMSVDVELIAPVGNDYVSPYVLGFGRDADDRMIVATSKGPVDAWHFVIERTSAQHRQRETFLIPELDDAFIHGIRVAGDGCVYFWSQTQIGRIALPEQTGAGSSGSAASGE